MRRPGNAKPKRGSTLPLLFGTPALLLVGVAVVSTTLLSRFDGKAGSAELDLDAAQTGVEKVLRDPVNGYGREDVSDVRCNGGHNPTVTKGGGFTCSVNVGGAPRHVAVQFTDDVGTYRVGQPR